LLAIAEVEYKDNGAPKAKLEDKRRSTVCKTVAFRQRLAFMPGCYGVVMNINKKPISMKRAFNGRST